MKAALLASIAVLLGTPACAGQAPFASSAADIPLGPSDRFYTGDQFSNTVSVVQPSTNRLLGVIRLGDPTPANLSPLYRGQLLVHGMGFSPDRRTLAVVSIGSNSLSFIDTATNQVKRTVYLGRSPHEAFFTPDGREVWVTIRGQSEIAIIDARTYGPKRSIRVPNGPGMTIFSPDGRYAYVCSSFTPKTVIIDTASKRIIGSVPQESPFCPNIAASPDGTQVWFTLKDVGRVIAFAARPPFKVLRTIATGPITNHVNFVTSPAGQFAYVTVAAENAVKVYSTRDFSLVRTICVGAAPHGIWPSGDGTRVYVGLENEDAVAAIDTASGEVIATIPIGQGPQGAIYVPGAVPSGDGMSNLVPPGLASQRVKLVLAGQGRSQVSLYDQGQVQILQAVAAGLIPGKPYVLSLSKRPDGGGVLQPLASFKANLAGAAIVNAVGPLRQLVRAEVAADRRFLVISPGTADAPAAPVQIQIAESPAR